jgi:hypothetical protein
MGQPDHKTFVPAQMPRDIPQVRGYSALARRSASRLRPASASSGPRSSSLPSRCSTSQPRHPGGSEKFQPNWTCVFPSGMLVTLRCSWLMIPNGTDTSTSRLWRSGATPVTVVTACQRLPNALDEKCNRCPTCSNPSGIAASNRADDQSVHLWGSISNDQTRSIGALMVAAGQTVTVIAKLAPMQRNCSSGADTSPLVFHRGTCTCLTHSRGSLRKGGETTVGAYQRDDRGDVQFPRKSVLAAAALGCLLDGDLVAEPLEALDGAAECCASVTLVEIVTAEVFVRGPVSDDAVGDDQNRVCHRDQCSFAASPGR